MSVYAQALDLVYGRPAAGVPSRLERLVADVADEPRQDNPRGAADGAGQALTRVGASVVEPGGSDRWLSIAQAVTSADGHLREWAADRLGEGSYRVVFDSDSYFANLGLSVAYFELSYAFRLRDEADSCHIQAMLGTHHYSIYSGTRG
jgi:5-hydroxyisourate hydrolase